MSAWIIYCHTHVASGKRYVGQTKQTMNRRWSDHVKDARAGSSLMLHRSIAKYGVDAFAHEILEEVATADAANDAERTWISRLGTMKPAGFNLDSGGRGGGERCADTVAQMRASAKAFAATETRAQRLVKSERMRNWRASMSPSEKAGLVRKQMASLTPERRSAIARAREDAMVPGKRKAAALQRWASVSPESRSAHMLASWAARSPEKRSADAAKGHARRVPGQQRKAATSQWASRTPEERSEIARKGWEKRRFASGVAS